MQASAQRELVNDVLVGVKLIDREIATQRQTLVENTEDAFVEARAKLTVILQKQQPLDEKIMALNSIFDGTLKKLRDGTADFFEHVQSQVTDSETTLKKWDTVQEALRKLFMRNAFSCFEEWRTYAAAMAQKAKEEEFEKFNRHVCVVSFI